MQFSLNMKEKISWPLYSIFFMKVTQKLFLLLSIDHEKPFFVSEKPRHLLRIAGEEDEHKVVPVDCVLEKSYIFQEIQATHVYQELQIFVAIVAES